MEMEEEGWGFLSLSAVILTIGAVLFAVRQFIKGAQFREKGKAKGKVVLVTGPSSGIGRQIAKILNLKGAKVYLLVRNEERGYDALRWMSKYGCDSTRLIVSKCDLDSFESIREFVKDFNKKEEQVDILINNAGVMFLPTYKQTVDGFEVMLQSNYLGHFLLTELLIPKFENAPSARIINVTSSLHTSANTYDLQKMNAKQEYGMFQSYARSKLANVLHAVELTKRLRRRSSGTKITVNSVHPGAVATDLVRFEIYTKVLKKMFKPFIWFFLKTDEDGAQTPLYCALSKKLDGVSGKYFSECKEAKPHEYASSAEAAEHLYNQSLEAVGLQSQ